MSGLLAVLVDLYDTLAWTEWPAMREELERRLDVSPVDLLSALDETRPARSVGAFGSLEGDLAAVLEAAGMRPDPGLIRELARRTRAFLSSGVHLWEESIPVLRTLRARGLRTAVVSNCDHGTRQVVERLGVDEEVDAVVLSFEVGAAKPQPGIYLTALARLGVEAGRAAFVDDQVSYCDGAAALGMETFLLLREDSSAAEGSSEPGGHRVIGDLRALLELL